MAISGALSNFGCVCVFVSVCKVMEAVGAMKSLV